MLSVTYAGCHLCWVSLMLSVTYAEGHLCWVSLMQRVTYAEGHLCRVSLVLSVTYAKCRKQALYADCHHAGSRYADRRGAPVTCTSDKWTGLQCCSLYSFGLISSYIYLNRIVRLSTTIVYHLRSIHAIVRLHNRLYLGLYSKTYYCRNLRIFVIWLSVFFKMSNVWGLGLESTLEWSTWKVLPSGNLLPSSQIWCSYKHSNLQYCTIP